MVKQKTAGAITGNGRKNGMYHHGGEIYGQNIQYDFSVNVNPLGMPPGVKHFLRSEKALHYAGIYPQNGNAELTEAIAKKEKVPPARIVCGNGASELIYAVFAALKPKSVLLSVPAFSEYEQAAVRYGSRVHYHDRMKEILDKTAFPPDEGLTAPAAFASGREEDRGRTRANILVQLQEEKPEMIVLCNPANPTGECIPPLLMKRILELAGQLKSTVLVDECFLPFVEGQEKRSAGTYLTDIGEEKSPALLILKAFTKFYAMPGLRLGYLMGFGIDRTEKVRMFLPDWNVSSIAQQAGILALGDERYEQDTREYLSPEREYMRTELGKLGAVIYGGEADFLFWRGRAGLKEELFSRGILIRDCSNFRGLEDAPKGLCYYRTAIRRHEENEVLLWNLREVLTGVGNRRLPGDMDGNGIC